MGSPRSSLFALVGCLALAALASGQQDAPPDELVWSYPAKPVGRDPLLADGGGQVFYVSSVSELKLFSAFGSQTPAPIWSAPPTVGHVSSFAVSSERDLVLTSEALVLGPNQIQSRVRAFRSSSPAPVWEIDFPVQDAFEPRCVVTPDGSRVVVIHDNPTMADQKIALIDPDSGATLQTYTVHLGYPTSIALSADGQTLAVSSYGANPLTSVIDLNTGNTLHAEPGAMSINNGLSADGKTLVVYVPNYSGPWGVRALKWNGSGFAAVLDLQLPKGAVCAHCVVSEDGSVLALAWNDNSFAMGRISIEAWDLATGLRSMQHPVFASGPMAPQTYPRDIGISADGSRFAVGLHSAQVGAVPELLVFSSTSDTPLFEFPDEGLVPGLDLSRDGRRLVVNRLDDASGTPGMSHVELYRLGPEDFALQGEPTLGASVNFELSGPVGATAFVLSSPGPGLAPLPIPGVGLLHLDRTQLTVVPLGPIGASGTLDHPLTLSSDPLQVGQTTSYQGWMRSPSLLTADWVQLTLLP